MNHTMPSDEKSGQPLLQDSINKPVYAGFWIRFWAYLLDLIVIGSLNRIIINPIFRWLDLPLNDEGFFSLSTVLTVVIFYLYFVLMTRFFGQTLGKMVFAIRVVTKEANSNVSWLMIMFREIVGRFISKVIIVGYLLAGITQEKVALHDIFADTRVIHTRK